MASPAVASRRRSLFFFRARAFLPDIAFAACARRVRGVCASLCSRLPRKALRGESR